MECLNYDLLSLICDQLLISDAFQFVYMLPLNLFQKFQNQKYFSKRLLNSLKRSSERPQLLSYLFENGVLFFGEYLFQLFLSRDSSLKTTALSCHFSETTLNEIKNGFVQQKWFFVDRCQLKLNKNNLEFYQWNVWGQRLNTISDKSNFALKLNLMFGKDIQNMFYAPSFSNRGLKIPIPDLFLQKRIDNYPKDNLHFWECTNPEYCSQCHEVWKTLFFLIRNRIQGSNMFVKNYKIPNSEVIAKEIHLVAPEGSLILEKISGFFIDVRNVRNHSVDYFSCECCSAGPIQLWNGLSYYWGLDDDRIRTLLNIPWNFRNTLNLIYSETEI